MVIIHRTIVAVLATLCLATSGSASFACRGDVADASGPGGDFTVNVFDLFQLLSQWGSDGPGANLAPPNNIIDVADLFQLLSQWGDCTIPEGDVCWLNDGIPLGFGNCQEPDQHGHGQEHVVAATSDLNPKLGVLVADNFRLIEPFNVISNVCWWGIYNTIEDGEECAPGGGDGSDDYFRIRFFASETIGDDAWPGELLATYVIGPRQLAINKIHTGNLVTGSLRMEFEYTAALQPFFVAPPNECIWMEITNQTVGDCSWQWSTAPGDNISVQDHGDGYSIDDLESYDLACCISGRIYTCAPKPDLYIQYPNFDNAFTSDVDANGNLSVSIAVADNFIVDGPAQSITSIEWWGLYLRWQNGWNVCSPDPDPSVQFRVTYYNDVSKLPGDIIGGPFLITPDDVYPLGTLIDTTYKFTARHPPVPVVDGQTVWISIQFADSHFCSFLWLTSDFGDEQAATAFDSEPFDTLNGNVAFSVNIDAIEPGGDETSRGDNSFNQTAP